MPLLHLAIEHWHANAAALLIARGALVNVKDDSSWTALQLAVDIEVEQAIHSNSSDIPDLFTNMLLKHGADPSLLDNDGLSAFDMAVQRGHTRAAALIEQSAKH